MLNVKTIDTQKNDEPSNHKKIINLFNNSCSLNLTQNNISQNNLGYIRPRQANEIIKKYKKRFKINPYHAVKMLEAYTKHNFICDSRIFKTLAFAYRDHNVKKSREYLEKAIKINPYDYQLYIQKVDNYLAKNEFNKDRIQKAERVLTDALDKIGPNPYIYYKLYIILKENNNDKALKYLQVARVFALKKAVKYNNLLTIIEEELLDEHIYANDEEGTIEIISSLQSRNLHLNPRDYGELANAYSELGEYELAEENYVKALEKEKNPESRANLLFDLGVIYADTKREYQAVNILNEIFMYINEEHELYEEVIDKINQLEIICSAKKAIEKYNKLGLNVLTFKKKEV